MQPQHQEQAADELPDIQTGSAVPTGQQGQLQARAQLADAPAPAHSGSAVPGLGPTDPAGSTHQTLRADSAAAHKAVAGHVPLQAPLTAAPAAAPVPAPAPAPSQPAATAAGAAAAAAVGPLVAAPAAPQLPLPPVASTNGRLLYLIVTPGAAAAGERRGEGGAPRRPPGPRYTRDSLRCLLQLLGCKPRLAHKIAGLVFSSVEAAVAPAGASGRQQRTSRRPFAVHPHGGEGRIAVSLPRPDFMQLVSAAAAQFAYKIAPTSDELKVATR
jgi:hypothetical protein